MAMNIEIMIKRFFLPVMVLRKHLRSLGSKNSPPREIRKDLVEKYSCGGRIPIEQWYLDDSYSTSNPRVYTRRRIDRYIRRIRQGCCGGYGMTDKWLYAALERHGVEGHQVAIMGSASPWYESICLVHGGKPTVVEYNRIISRDPRINVLLMDDFEKNPFEFDAAFSISSFEHDGLGRYGDPLNPRGDLDAMENMKKTIRPGGLLFLAVPLGKDRVVWNAHRIYGRIRLPMLLKGWSVLESFGFSEKDLDAETNRGKKIHHQPIFVLKNESRKPVRTL